MRILGTARGTKTTQIDPLQPDHYSLFWPKTMMRENQPTSVPFRMEMRHFVCSAP